MKLPTEMTLFDPATDCEFRVRFDYFRGEEQWFDARAGVGSPGCDPSVDITEVNFGTGWELPNAYPQLNLDAIGDEVMQRLADIEADAQAARDEAEYNAFNERI